MATTTTEWWLSSVCCQMMVFQLWAAGSTQPVVASPCVSVIREAAASNAHNNCSRFTQRYNNWQLEVSHRDVVFASCVRVFSSTCTANFSQWGSAALWNGRTVSFDLQCDSCTHPRADEESLESHVSQQNGVAALSSTTEVEAGTCFRT